MKKLFIIIMVLFSVAVHAQQKVTRDQAGNFTAVHSVKSEAVNTGKTYTDAKGVKYPVYRSASGKYYVIRTSRKTGAAYKYYLQF